MSSSIMRVRTRLGKEKGELVNKDPAVITREMRQRRAIHIHESV